MITYTADQVASTLHCDVHKVALLRKCGLLHGIRMGKKGWIYSEDNLRDFWKEYIDEDLSDPESVRLIANAHKANKKRD